MSNRKLSEREMRYISVFEELTGAVAHDCFVYEDHDKILIVVRSGDMSVAIGKRGENVESVEDEIGLEVELIEYSEIPENFVANAFQPAAIERVEIKSESKGGDGEEKRTAFVDVPDGDKGLAIGENGKNVEKVRHLVKRHYDIDDVVIE